LLLADRATQRSHYLNIKGASFSPFKRAMETQMAGLLAKLMANVRAENKKRGYTYVSANNTFVPTPGFTMESAQLPPEPLPNLFDISFNIKAVKKGAPYLMEFGDFAYMKPEDRAEFGNLYLEIQQQKADTQRPQVNEEAEADAMVSEANAQEVQGEVLPQIEI
jgi:hypothetical protein